MTHSYQPGSYCLARSWTLGHDPADSMISATCGRPLCVAHGEVEAFVAGEQQRAVVHAAMAKSDAEALRAVEAESTNAAALTTLGLLELPRQRTSALVTLKSATLCASSTKAPAGAWGAARAASVLRACTRAASLKNKADDAYLRGDLDGSIEYYGEAIATAPPEDSARGFLPLPVPVSGQGSTAS